MAEQTLFQKYFGDSPKLRILEHLIIGRAFDYSLTDITEGAGVAWKTTLKVIPELKREGLVVQTRTVGNAKLFKINEKNPIAALIVKTFYKIIQLSGPITEKAVAKVR
jgi:predicted transcriptional regulator